jgi:hydroxyacylglutathione hydrolase
MKTITTQALKELLDKGTPIQLIDQRTSREYDNGHIDGAIHHFKDDLEAIPETLRKDIPVIIYCIYGIKSKGTAEILTQAGFDVTVLEGGVYQWKKDVDSSLFIL